MSGHFSDPPHRPGPVPREPAAPTSPGALAALLAQLPPSLGPVRLVAVDGHAGSGKSTFAARLAEELGAAPGMGASGLGGAPGCAPVLPLDDVASHDALFAWVDRLRNQVLDPLAAGRTARYEVYDWERRQFGPEIAEIPAAPVVLLEGVGAGRRELRPFLACLLWMDMPQRQAAEHGLRRDGPRLAEFWEGWTRAERTHFADDPSSPHANFLVSRGDRGHTVRAGPVRLT